MNRLYINKDWSTLKKLIAMKAAGGGAPLVEYTVTGNPATFETNVIAPMELLIPFTPVQDLHGQESPYPAGGGKNKLSADSFSLEKPDTRTKFVVLEKAIPAGDYIFSGKFSGTSTSVSIAFQGENGQQIALVGYSQTGDFSTSVALSEPCTRLYCYISNSQADGVTANFTQMMVRLSTVTDGTFAPYENLCPISGWTGAKITGTGKNLFDDTPRENDKTAIVTLPPGTYYFKAFLPTQSANETNTRFEFYYDNQWNVITANGDNYYDNNGIHWNGYSFGWLYYDTTTVVTLTKTYQVRCNINSTSHAMRRMAIYLDNETTFAEYTGETHPITFPSTVYGGTVKVNKDGSRKLVVEMLYGEMPACNSTGSSSIAGSTGKYATFDFSGLPAFKTTQNEKNVIFDAMDNVEWANRGQAWQGYVNSQAMFGCFIPSNMTKEEVTSLIQGTHYCVKLATPVEIDLTDSDAIVSLLGVNNVWSDTNGENTVKYMKKG